MSCYFLPFHTRLKKTIMFKIPFNNDEIVRRSLVLPQYNQIELLIESNAKKLSNLQKLYGKHIKNQNPIKHLLDTLPIDITLTDVEQANVIYGSGLEVASAIGFFTPISKGKAVNSFLFDKRCPEVIMVVLEDDERLVKCLRCPFQDLNFYFDDFAAIEQKTEPAVFSLALIPTVMKYRKYVNETNKPSTADFIATVILPEVLEDVINLTLLNRLLAHIKGDGVFKSPARNPPLWIDVSDKLDDIQISIADTLLSSDGHPDTIAGIVPIRNGLKIDKVTSFPTTIINSNVVPVVFLAAFPLLCFVLEISNRTESNHLNTRRKKIKKELAALVQDKTFFSENLILKVQQEKELYVLKGLL